MTCRPCWRPLSREIGATTVEGAELGQLGEERGGEDEADPGHRGQEREAVLELGIGGDGAVHEGLDLAAFGDEGVETCDGAGRDR